MKTRMHKNSLKAYGSLKLQPRELAVLNSYMGWGAATDRQINMIHSNVTGLSVQPRITYLLKKKLLMESGTTKCHITGRTVRLCEITKKGIKALAK
jgi:hypothetical protein